jgi:hypothetical protein
VNNDAAIGPLVGPAAPRVPPAIMARPRRSSRTPHSSPPTALCANDPPGGSAPFTEKPCCAIRERRTFQSLRIYVLILVKRFRVLRCLVVLLSLALASSNTHAVLHLPVAHAEPCPEQHAHHSGQTSHHHQHDKGLACCCNCLGCSSAAYIAPEPSSTPAELPGRVHYDALTASLSGRALLPEPDPPRPGTLS